MRIYLAVPIVVVALASPANADWQYTRWGMSAQQVTAASRGAAKPNTNEAADTGTHRHERALLSGPYAAGRMNFRAVFYFGNSDGKLTKVRLVLGGGADCTDVRADLMKLYGQPVSTAAGIATRWRDTKRKNTVTLANWGNGGCNLEYEPLDPTGGRL